MLKYALLIGVVVFYFYTVTCVFFTVRIAALKGRRRAWGWLGLFFGLLGLIAVSFLPNAKGVTGETNPVRALARKITGISPVAVWIMLTGILVVGGGVLIGNRVTIWAANRSYEKTLSQQNTESGTLLSPSVINGKVKSVWCGDGNNFVVTESGDLYGFGAVDLLPLDENGVLYKNVERIQVVGKTYFLLTTDHTLWAKGDNTNGLILGQSEQQVDHFVKIERDVVDFSVSVTACALVKESGNLYVWGKNSYGQLGRAEERVLDTNDRLAGDVLKVCMSSRWLVYLTREGAVYGVGSNAFGQFGQGNTDNAATPVQLAEGCKDLAAGSDFLLLLKEDGTVESAGNAGFGQLGRDSGNQTEAASSGNATSEDSSSGDSSSGDSSSEGSSSEGSSAAEKAAEQTNTSKTFRKLETLKEVDAIFAAGHSAFAKSGTTVYGWGENAYSQLGDGSHQNQRVPVLVHRKAAQIAVGTTCTLILTAEGKILGTGDHRDAKLGQNESGESFRDLAPVKEGK